MSGKPTRSGGKRPGAGRKRKGYDSDLSREAFDVETLADLNDTSERAIIRHSAELESDVASDERIGDFGEDGWAHRQHRLESTHGRIKKRVERGARQWRTAADGTVCEPGKVFLRGGAHPGYADTIAAADAELPPPPLCPGCAAWQDWWIPHWHCEGCGAPRSGAPARVLPAGPDGDVKSATPVFAGWYCGECILDERRRAGQGGGQPPALVTTPSPLARLAMARAQVAGAMVSEQAPANAAEGPAQAFARLVGSEITEAEARQKMADEGMSKADIDAAVARALTCNPRR